MSQKNWKLLFQEKAFFLKLMESDSGKLTRPEALALVLGEGRRLDDLVRNGWILILEEKILPGPGLMLARQFPDSPSSSEIKTYWDDCSEQLRRAIQEMKRAGSLQVREEKGAIVFEYLVFLRSWAYLLHGALAGEEPKARNKIALEFEMIAGELKIAVLRSSAFPEWEREQWELIDFLEEQASYLKGTNQVPHSERLRKIKAITTLQKEEMLYSTNLKSMVESGDFILLHKKLGVVAWPFFPPQERSNNPEINTTLIQLGSQSVSPDHLIPAWKASGMDLFSFLGQNASRLNLTEEETLSAFSTVLAEAGEGLVWKKDSSGKQWEVWPAD